MAKVVVVGSINMDLVNRVEHSPDAGETVPSEGTSYHPGGKGANQAVAAARTGAAAVMIGAVGDDPFGPVLLAALADRGVDTSCVQVKPGSSGLAFITVDRRGENRIILSAGANGRLTAEDTSPMEELLKDTSCILLQNEIPWETGVHVMEKAKAAGVRVLLNPAPARRMAGEELALVDILILNESEAAVLTGAEVADRQSAEAAAEWLLRQGPAAVLITLGAQGAVYLVRSEGTSAGRGMAGQEELGEDCEAERRLAGRIEAITDKVNRAKLAVPELSDAASGVGHEAGAANATFHGVYGADAGAYTCWYQPSFPVEVVDTTAAGDTFIGAFAAALTAGADEGEALRMAAAAAALTVTRLGAQSAIPTLAEIRTFLEGK